MLPPGPEMAYLPPNFALFSLQSCIGQLILASTIHSIVKTNLPNHQYNHRGSTELIREKIVCYFTSRSRNCLFALKFHNFCPTELYWTVFIIHDYSFHCQNRHACRSVPVLEGKEDPYFGLFERGKLGICYVISQDINIQKKFNVQFYLEHLKNQSSSSSSCSSNFFFN